MAKIKKQLKYSFLILIKFYRFFISPLLGVNCRFSPSCSKYAFIAFSRFGVLKGACLSIWRICRCHPFHPGGVDPVPSKKKTNFI